MLRSNLPAIRFAKWNKKPFVYLRRAFLILFVYGFENLLFCAAIRSLKKSLLIINVLTFYILHFGSCGAIFRACLLEKTGTGVVQ
jgi:hypothetical protein